MMLFKLTVGSQNRKVSVFAMGSFSKAREVKEGV
jgi:hypothetical protein